MAKPKYSPETKLAVVNHYLSGKDGEQSTADLFGIERTSVRRWVRAWQFHGAEGLTAKNNHYSDEFKLVVVRAVISDRLTMREAAAGLISPQKYLSGAGSTCTTMPERKVF